MMVGSGASGQQTFETVIDQAYCTVVQVYAGRHSLRLIDFKKFRRLFGTPTAPNANTNSCYLYWLRFAGKAPLAHLFFFCLDNQPLRGERDAAGVVGSRRPRGIEVGIVG